MAKSRFRYWLGVGILGGILITFFKIGIRHHLPPADRHADHNGIQHQPASLSSTQRNGLNQHYGGQKIAAFASLVDHVTPATPDSIFWIGAEQAWQWVSNQQAVLLDLRSYDDYQARHPRGARSFSAARLPDLEATFPDKNQNYILSNWQDIDIAEVTGAFTQRGYHFLYALDMSSSRAGPYKMSEWEQANLPVETEKVFHRDSVIIKLGNYEIFKDSLGNLTRLAHFPLPTIDLLLQYRPRLVEQYGYDEDNEAFRNEIGDIESIISAATSAGNKIWVGLSFYQGRGHQGYGGIGFYDLSTDTLGVLRHPALVNHSVRDLMVTEEMIFVATIDEYELSREVGNGLVMIDRKTLQVSALVPPGTPVIWYKDGGENVALYYDKSIPEILADSRFIAKAVEGWDPIELGTALNLGLENYMMRAAERER